MEAKKLKEVFKLSIASQYNSREPPIFYYESLGSQ